MNSPDPNVEQADIQLLNGKHIPLKKYQQAFSIFIEQVKSTDWVVTYGVLSHLTSYPTYLYTDFDLKKSNDHFVQFLQLCVDSRDEPKRKIFSFQDNLDVCKLYITSLTDPLCLPQRLEWALSAAAAMVQQSLHATSSPLPTFILPIQGAKPPVFKSSSKPPFIFTAENALKFISKLKSRLDQKTFAVSCHHWIALISEHKKSVKPTKSLSS